MTSTPSVPVLDHPEVLPARPDTARGEHDRFAHYCRKADIVRSAVTGESIVALCGKRWVPTRDPDRYPVCQTCVELLAAGKSEISG